MIQDAQLMLSLAHDRHRGAIASAERRHLLTAARMYRRALRRLNARKSDQGASPASPASSGSSGSSGSSASPDASAPGRRGGSLASCAGRVVGPAR